MKIENHYSDRRQKTRVRLNGALENSDNSGHLRTPPDTSGHQKKKPFFHACIARPSNFSPTYKPKSRFFEHDVAPRSIKLPKTSSNFVDPKKTNPLFSSELSASSVVNFSFYRTALTKTNA
jgi:hypothetical protein